MASLNKVTLIGNLGRDPEIKTFANGGRIASLRIATSESWKDKSTGEKKEKTEWHSVTITNEGIVKVAENYLKKGSTVYIEGQLETRKWQDQSGADRYSTEIVLRPYAGELKMLGGKPGGGSSQQDNGTARYDDGGGGKPGPEDEIPF